MQDRLNIIHLSLTPAQAESIHTALERAIRYGSLGALDHATVNIIRTTLSPWSRYKEKRLQETTTVTTTVTTRFVEVA